jgi:hypothetical protein
MPSTSTILTVIGSLVFVILVIVAFSLTLEATLRNNNKPLTTTERLLNKSITFDKLGDDVRAALIVPITTTRLANECVTESKLNDRIVTDNVHGLDVIAIGRTNYDADFTRDTPIVVDALFAEPIPTPVPTVNNVVVSVSGGGTHINPPTVVAVSSTSAMIGMMAQQHINISPPITLDDDDRSGTIGFGVDALRHTTNPGSNGAVLMLPVLRDVSTANNQYELHNFTSYTMPGTLNQPWQKQRTIAMDTNMMVANTLADLRSLAINVAYDKMHTPDDTIDNGFSAIVVYRSNGWLYANLVHGNVGDAIITNHVNGNFIPNDVVLDNSTNNATSYVRSINTSLLTKYSRHFIGSTNRSSMIAASHANNTILYRERITEDSPWTVIRNVAVDSKWFDVSVGISIDHYVSLVAAPVPGELYSMTHSVNEMSEVTSATVDWNRIILDTTDQVWDGMHVVAIAFTDTQLATSHDVVLAFADPTTIHFVKFIGKITSDTGPPAFTDPVLLYTDHYTGTSTQGPAITISCQITNTTHNVVRIVSHDAGVVKYISLDTPDTLVFTSAQIPFTLPTDMVVVSDRIMATTDTTVKEYHHGDVGVTVLSTPSSE